MGCPSTAGVPLRSPETSMYNQHSSRSLAPNLPVSGSSHTSTSMWLAVCTPRIPSIILIGSRPILRSTTPVSSSCWGYGRCYRGIPLRYARPHRVPRSRSPLQHHRPVDDVTGVRTGYTDRLTCSPPEWKERASKRSECPLGYEFPDAIETVVAFKRSVGTFEGLLFSFRYPFVLFDVLDGGSDYLRSIHRRASSHVLGVLEYFRELSTD